MGIPKMPVMRYRQRRRQPIICLDFDGVIHLHLSPWRGRAVISDGPVQGAKEAVEDLRRRGNRIVVFSGRCASDDGVNAIKVWLNRHDIEVDDVARNKPVADLYVDDKAVTFRGDWVETLEAIHKFQQWQVLTKTRLRGLRKIRRLT